jgi:hypothetical protein
MDLDSRVSTHVVWRSCQGIGLLSRLKLLRQAVVGNSEISVSFKEDVLRLEVSVDEAEVVEVLHGQEDLRGVELGPFFSKLFALTEVGEHLAPADEVHDEEDLFLGLEGEL